MSAEDNWHAHREAESEEMHQLNGDQHGQTVEEEQRGGQAIAVGQLQMLSEEGQSMMSALCFHRPQGWREHHRSVEFISCKKYRTEEDDVYIESIRQILSECGRRFRCMATTKETGEFNTIDWDYRKNFKIDERTDEQWAAMKRPSRWDSVFGYTPLMDAINDGDQELAMKLARGSRSAGKPVLYGNETAEQKILIISNTPSAWTVAAEQGNYWAFKFLSRDSIFKCQPLCKMVMRLQRTLRINNRKCTPDDIGDFKVYMSIAKAHSHDNYHRPLWANQLRTACFLALFHSIDLLADVLVDEGADLLAKCEEGFGLEENGQSILGLSKTKKGIDPCLREKIRRKAQDQNCEQGNMDH